MAPGGFSRLLFLLHPDRTEFYEQYGVLRDMHQNHLTEILMSLAMELPANLTNSEEVLRSKLGAFSCLQSLEKNSAVIGQYEAYGAHVREELQKGQDFFTKTPTFAGKILTPKAGGGVGCHLPLILSVPAGGKKPQVYVLCRS